MNYKEFREEMAALALALRATIGTGDGEYGDDDVPGIDVTVGVDADGWNYQTGDNSFTGGAYGFAHWGVAWLSVETNAYDFADVIIASLEENDEFNFDDGAQS